MDRIRIYDLEVFCHHGVFPEENKLGQKFIISLDLYLHTRVAGMNDDLSQSIHYGEVSHFVHDFMKNNTFKLLETVTEQLARKLLIELPLLEEIAIELKKPWAPIGLPLSYASCCITRKWHDVYLGVGSNIGDRHAYIQKAIKQLQNCEDIRVEKVSTLLTTKPYGEVVQDDFLNGCIYIKTLLTPNELLEELHLIERQLDREREIHWGPRTIDLDILFYDNEIIYQEDLVIPHIDMCHRMFVLEPLSEIAPYVIHPVNQMSVMQLKKQLENKQG